MANNQTAFPGVSRSEPDQIAAGGWDSWQNRSKSWEWNWLLLIITSIVGLLVVAGCFYSYRRTVQQIAPELMVLADQAEQSGDWRLTADRLTRYLKFRGDDLEATKRLAELYYLNASSLEDTKAGLRMYSRCVAKSSPTDDDYLTLQLRYVAMLSVVNPASGLNVLGKMVPPVDEFRQALELQPELVEALNLRIVLLEDQLAASSAATEREYQETLIEDYERLSAIDLAEARHLQRLASLYRIKADSVEIADKRFAQQLRNKADQIMDDVVESHPDDIDVLLRRFEYRLRNAKSRHPDTSDLRRALELDRSNPRALLNLANFMADPRTEANEVSRASLYAARDFLSESMESMPDQAFVPVALSRIFVRLKDPVSAKRVLDEAAEKFPSDYGVHVAQTSLAISQRRFEEANAGIERIRGLANKTLSYARSDGDKQVSAIVQKIVADVLEATLLLDSGADEAQRESALALLKDVDQARLQSRDRYDVLEQVAMLFNRLEEREEAIEALERGRIAGVVSLNSELLLADCYERTGENDRAIAVYREITARPLTIEQAEDVWFRLGMLALRTQSARLQTRRDWRDVEVAVKELERIAPASENTFLLKMYLQLSEGIKDRSAVITELQRAEPKFGKSVQYWLLCSDVYRELEDYKLLQQAMDRISEVTDVVPGSMLEASQRSAVLTTRLSDDDRLYFQRISDPNTRRSDADTVLLVRNWCEELPESIPARFALVELGKKLRQPALIDEAMQSMREIEAGDGYFWRIAEVEKHLLLMREGNQRDGNEARRKIETLVRRYPGQRQVHELAGLCQEVCGDNRAASQAYLTALKIQPSEESVDGRLRTLINLRDWDEALKLIEALQPEQKLAPSRLELAVHTLCEHRKFSDASQTIEQAIESGRIDEAHANYLLGVVAFRERSRRNAIEAHERMVRATELAPSHLNYWIALLHLEISYYPELWTREATRTANRLRWLLHAHRDSDGEFASSWSSLILAQTLQMQGRLADADEFFRKTVVLEPSTRELGWIPSQILSKDATASKSGVTPAVAWLAGEENARTLSAIQALWFGQTQPGLEIPDDETRLHALIALRNGDDASALELLELINPRRRGSGDYLLLATLYDRLGDATAARLQRVACLKEPNVTSVACQEVLNHAMATDDDDLARQCLNASDGQFLGEIERQLLDARMELASIESEENLQEWAAKQLSDLPSDTDEGDFRLRLANMLADEGQVDAALSLISQHDGDNTDRQAFRVWLASQPWLLEQAVVVLQKAQLEEPPSVIIEMLYRLSLHLPEQSDYRQSLIELSKSIFNASLDISPTDWTKLASTFEHLMLPELAVKACERALEQVGSPSLAEHYLIWLRGGYLNDLPTAQQDLDRLIRLYGPRDDLMDTRAVLLICGDDSAAARVVTRELTLHDPLHGSYRFNDRLAVASLLPEPQRREALRAIDAESREDASVLARRKLDEWLNGGAINANP